MENQAQNYFCYPTTVVIVDDDKKFLSGLGSTLGLNKNELIKTFSKPEEAFTYLKNQSFLYHSYQKYLETISSLELDIDDKDRVSKVNFARILELIYDKKRFDEVSVIVADYFMPNTNGLEFFEGIKDTPAKKILLTSNKDYQLAVDAFNEGIIDKFIIKEINMIEKISDSIDELKHKYFQEFSSVLLQAFDRGIKKADQYMAVFVAWHTDNQILEYYQCDGNGSCIGFDKNGIIHWLLISSDEEINGYANVIKDINSSLPMITSLDSKTSLLFFLTERDKQQPVSKWEKYMFPVYGDFVVNQKKYFYSYVMEESLGIDLKQVITLCDIKK
jgi:CheY-like chemotaxis protein